jgi:hypothetical protein
MRESDDDMTSQITQAWRDPLPYTEAIRIERHTNASQDPRYILQDLSASYYDAECTAAPSRIPPWIQPAEKALIEGGHGTTPDLTYAREVPDSPDPGIANFDKKFALSFS